MGMGIGNTTGGVALSRFCVPLLLLLHCLDKCHSVPVDVYVVQGFCFV